MKDLGEGNYILGIKLLQDHRNKMLGLSQTSYVDKILVKFAMYNSKKELLPFRLGVSLSKEQCPKTFEDEQCIKAVPYVSVVRSLMYAMLCTRPDIYYAVGMVSKYQSNLEPEYWTTIKHIFKYLRRTGAYMLTQGGSNLIPIDYTNLDFMSDMNFRKSTFGYVFILWRVTISWRSIKQQYIAESTTEAEYIIATEEAKEVVWLKKFLLELGVVL